MNKKWLEEELISALCLSEYKIAVIETTVVFERKLIHWQQDDHAYFEQTSFGIVRICLPLLLLLLNGKSLDSDEYYVCKVEEKLSIL